MLMIYLRIASSKVIKCMSSIWYGNGPEFHICPKDAWLNAKGVSIGALAPIVWVIAISSWKKNRCESWKMTICWAQNMSNNRIILYRKPKLDGAKFPSPWCQNHPLQTWSVHSGSPPIGGIRCDRGGMGLTPCSDS